MTYWQIISAAAKAAKVSAVLLYAICSHESNGFMYDYTMYDNGSPSFSVCQVKLETAKMLGFKGNPMELRNPHVGIKYAALYLKYQQDRYGEDWVRLAASFNAGSYVEGKIKGCPRNLRYLQLVQKKLDNEHQHMLDCKENRNFVDTLGELYESG